MKSEVFHAYPKTPRFGGAQMTITEKIDGTNAQVTIRDGEIVGVGSRKRLILPDVPAAHNDEGYKISKKIVRDNYGFAAWVYDNAAGLVEFLGEGTHYGEWAGLGIQGNPLKLDKKAFFLFNTHANPPEKFGAYPNRPRELTTVPVLYEGDFCPEMIYTVHENLLWSGTHVYCAPEDGTPEGIIISAFGTKFKLTDDPRPKGVR